MCLCPLAAAIANTNCQIVISLSSLSLMLPSQTPRCIRLDSRTTAHALYKTDDAKSTGDVANHAVHI